MIMLHQGDQGAPNMATKVFQTDSTRIMIVAGCQER